MLGFLRIPLAVALCLTLCACNVNRGLRRAFGIPEPPGAYLAVLLEVHEKGNWEFRPDADEPLKRAREAVRKLPACVYEDWAEVGRVVLVLSEMAQEHPASLVRAECIDALARLAAWQEFEGVARDGSITEAEMIRALKQLREASEYDAEDAAGTFGVADAIRTASAFPFYQSSGAEKLDHDEVLSRYATGLRTARGVLNTLGRPEIERFAAEPDVRRALETGNIAVSKAAVNLTLLERALADPQDLNRVAALHHLSRLRFEGAASVLARGVLEDESLAVRREAVWALAELPRDTCVPTLIDALADVMSEVRNAASRALNRKTGKSFGVDRRAWALWWRDASGAGPEPEDGGA